MLKIGDSAPPFTARATDGSTVALEQLRNKPVILYFFHKAFTPNCTVETKGFRDNYGELSELGFALIGVSTDSFETQCSFATKHGVSYPMLADDDLTISKAYRVLWPIIPYARRVAYVMDGEHKVLAVFRHEFQANKHLDEVIRFARAWRREQTTVR
jgi:peroxiredoxin